MQNQNFKEEFVSFKEELSSFVFRLVTNQQDVEDIVQDTFVKVDKSIDSFRGNSTFKTWVFAIATNTAKNYLKKRNRWSENAQDYGANLHMQSEDHWNRFIDVFNSTPDKIYEIEEHISYCFNCINKTLETSQQICLLLKEVYEFKISEIMEISGLSEGKVKHALANARKNMVRIFDNRCALVNKQGACHQCTSLTGILNPKQNAQIKANEIEMVKNSNSHDKEHLFNLRMDIIKRIDPLNAPNSLVNIYMLENCEDWVKEGKRKKVFQKPSDSTSQIV